MVQRKTCSRCGEDKPLNQFVLLKSGYGLSQRCKLCKKKQGYAKYRFLKMRFPASDYISVESKAHFMGYSIENYIIWLHRKNMDKKII
jgi:hypothetical protein